MAILFFDIMEGIEEEAKGSNKVFFFSLSVCAEPLNPLDIHLCYVTSTLGNIDLLNFATMGDISF